jgi:hypothetical protein
MLLFLIYIVVVVIARRCCFFCEQVCKVLQKSAPRCGKTMTRQNVSFVVVPLRPQSWPVAAGKVHVFK